MRFFNSLCPLLKWRRSGAEKKGGLWLFLFSSLLLLAVAWTCGAEIVASDSKTVLDTDHRSEEALNAGITAGDFLIDTAEVLSEPAEDYLLDLIRRCLDKEIHLYVVIRKKSIRLAPDEEVSKSNEAYVAEAGEEVFLKLSERDKLAVPEDLAIMIYFSQYERQMKLLMSGSALRLLPYGYQDEIENRIARPFIQQPDEEAALLASAESLRKSLEKELNIELSSELPYELDLSPKGKWPTYLALGSIIVIFLLLRGRLLRSGAIRYKKRKER